MSDEEMLACCEKTGLSELVFSQPKGLDLEVGEGGRGVSGGQRQLIALTRLLIAKPCVWLLDEPTAAMDEQTELRSLNALRQSILPEQTVLLVTHKFSLIGLAERLIVLASGRVLLDGPRDAVLDHLRKEAEKRMRITKNAAGEGL